LLTLALEPDEVEATYALQPPPHDSVPLEHGAGGGGGGGITAQLWPLNDSEPVEQLAVIEPE
jgi:hypothetical protein